ncbi:MAG: helix-hairpin-helix domain-containing protein, partial [Sinobacterium sp.]
SVGININTANAELLADVLSGVGRAKAEAIVAYRQANGKFLSIDDLALVKGIGATTVELNKSMVTAN